MLNLNSLILFSEKPKELVEFYKRVFQKEPTWKAGVFVGFVVGYGTLLIGPHDKVKGPNTNPERMIINLETKDVETEFKKLQVLGARVIQKPYHPQEDPQIMLATFADSDGNYFQLATPHKKGNS